MQEVSGSIPLSSTKLLPKSLVLKNDSRCGGIAQLGERLHGMQEVSGSIPLISTNSLFSSKSMNCKISSEYLYSETATVLLVAICENNIPVACS